MQPLKILILGRDADVFATPGGAPNDTRERHIRYVQELQRRRPGSEVRIVAHTFGRGPRTEQPIAGMRLFGTQSRSRLFCPINVVRLIRSFHRDGWIPDVISCQTGYEEGPIALSLAKPESRVQIQLHSDFYGDAMGREGFVRRLQRRIIRWSVRRCDHARVVSPTIERKMLGSGDIEPDRVTVAPVPAAFQEEKSAPEQRGSVVLFVGRLVAVKDLGLWCDAAELVHRERPDVEFWIVGEGEERSMLERRMPALEGKMRLLGEVAYAELAAIYAKAGVFLMTSVYEGLPRVVVEAMLAKVPVVSVDVPGPRDLIEDRKTGRLVARDAKCLAEALLELFSDEQLARRMAEEAHDWVIANHSFEAGAGKLVDSWEAAARLPKRRV